MKGPVRTDLEPLAKRFGTLGTICTAHWQGWVIGAGGAPGPSDIFIQGLLMIDPHDLQALKTAYPWTSVPDDWSTRVNTDLRPYLPPSGDWRTNERFTTDVATASYHGNVYLDLAGGTVFIDVVTA